MQDRNRNLWGYLFITPQLIGLLAFWVIPLLFTFTLSTMKWDGFGAKEFIGLENFITTLTDPDFQKAMINTVYYTILTIPPQIILGLLVAVALNKVKGKTFYRTFFFMPVVTSSVSIGVIWMWILNGDFGILNQALSFIGITGPKWLTDTNWVIPSISLLSVWWGFGFYMVIFLAGLQGISSTYYEAAEIDGANRFHKFWHITLPLLSSTTFLITTMAIIGSFQVFDQAFVMTNGGPAKASYTLVYHIYDKGFIEFKMGQSASAATIMFLIIFTWVMQLE